MRVVVAGGGVAAAECLLALRELAGERARLTLVAPEREFVLRPLRVAEPFSTGHVLSRPVAELAEAAGAELVVDALASVAPERRSARLAQGGAVGYDALVLAVGARRRTAYARAITFTGERRSTVYNGLLADLDERWTTSVAFVVPPGTTWPLPLYELALQTARQARAMGVEEARLTLLTPEPAPLAVFGERSSRVVAALLAEAGIDFVGGVEVEPDAEGRLRHAGGPVAAQRVVALPTLEGPHIPGVPGDREGFIRVDDHGRVEGLDRVYAAGDGTTVPIKQGGVAAQLAETIARAIAQATGAPVELRPFEPELRAQLLVGEGVQLLPPEGNEPEIRPLDAALKVHGPRLAEWLRAAAG